MASFNNFLMVFSCFGYGFGYSITSKLGRLMVTNQISLAKKKAFYGCLILFILGLIFSLTFVIFRKYISKTFCALFKDLFGS